MDTARFKWGLLPLWAALRQLCTNAVEAHVDANGAARARVLIGESDAFAREALVLLLSKDERVEVVADSGDALEALELVKRLRPDVVVLDLNACDQRSVLYIRRLRAMNPDVRVLLLCGFDDEPTVLGAVLAGVDGLLLKRACQKFCVRA